MGYLRTFFASPPVLRRSTFHAAEANLGVASCGFVLSFNLLNILFKSVLLAFGRELLTFVLKFGERDA